MSALILLVSHIFFGNKTQLVASDISLATSFFISWQSSSRAHSAAPRFQTEPASLGFGLGPPLRGGFFWSREDIDFNRSFQNERHLLKADVFRFGFRRLKGGSTPRHLNARGRQSRPCAIPGLWPGIYAPLGARPGRAVGRFSHNGPVNPKYRF